MAPRSPLFAAALATVVAASSAVEPLVTVDRSSQAVADATAALRAAQTREARATLAEVSARQSRAAAEGAAATTAREARDSRVMLAAIEDSLHVARDARAHVGRLLRGARDELKRVQAATSAAADAEAKRVVDDLRRQAIALEMQARTQETLLNPPPPLATQAAGEAAGPYYVTAKSIADAAALRRQAASGAAAAAGASEAFAAGRAVDAQLAGDGAFGSGLQAQAESAAATADAQRSQAAQLEREAAGIGGLAGGYGAAAAAWAGRANILADPANYVVPVVGR